MGFPTVEWTNEELIIGLRHIAHTMERNGHSYYQHVAEEAIKVLEQQTFINKPCISEGVCREDKIQVLDKIKDEVENLTYYSWEVSPRTVINDVLAILDKYRTESEE